MWSHGGKWEKVSVLLEVKLTWIKNHTCLVIFNWENYKPKKCICIYISILTPKISIIILNLKNTWSPITKREHVCACFLITLTQPGRQSEQVFKIFITLFIYIIIKLLFFFFFLKLTSLTSHLRDGIWQQGVELLVGAVPNSTPAGRLKVLPDATQANGHPLAQQRVGVRQLLQTVGY